MAARKIIVGRGAVRVEYRDEFADRIDGWIRRLIPDLMEYLDDESDRAKSVIDRKFPRRTGRALASLEEARWVGAKFNWIKAGVRTDLQYAYKFRMKGRSRKKRTASASTVQRKRPTAWKAIVRRQYTLTTLNNERLKQLIREAFRGAK